MKQATKYILFIAALASLTSGIVYAQTTPAQVTLTWHANNFYPADYAAKALAAPNTPISVAVEVIKNNKHVDLSQATISWYVDEKFLNRDKGLDEAIFNVSKISGDSHFARVKIVAGTETYESSVNIPIVKNSIILPIPYPNRSVTGGNQISLQAIPYFFNITSLQDLAFTWQVNNQAVEGNDSQLTLKLGTPQSESDRLIQINVLAQNQKNPLEFFRYRTDVSVY